MVHDFKNFPELTNRQINEFGFESPHKQIQEDFEARVVKVHDGDTVTLRARFRDFDFPLRLLDIDAPELNEGGELARDWLKNRILGDRVEIIIERDKRVDKKGRLLGRIIHRGIDVGMEELIYRFAVPFGQRREGMLPNLDKMFSLKQWF